jgi:hypothetical protein
MIESHVEWVFAPYDADNDAEDNGHPQQCGKAPAETDAAECGKDDQNAHSQKKANQHLG